MPIWSRIRSLLGLLTGGEREEDGRDEADEPGDAAPAAAPAPPGPPADAGADAQRRDRSPELGPGPEPAAAAGAGPATPAPLAGVIDDWNARTATGIITLGDGAVVGVGVEACQEFVPLIGLRVEVLATGIPPQPADADAAPEADEVGLWATAVRLQPGTESEYAARLRINQVERAVRGAEGVVFGEPPWARNKVGKKPAGPRRPDDAFFVLTVVLEEGHTLPTEPAALAALLASDFLRRPTVRIIPLSRKGKPEPGFSAEVTADGGKRRAFLLYRPQPYAGSDGPPEGAAAGHVGLFVGGPHSPRVSAQLAGGPAPKSIGAEVRLLSDLARSLLRGEPGALGLVVNRASKAWKPRDIALSQLGEEDSGRVPFVLWIDWDLGERDGRRVQLSRGMESLGLPDVAVAAPDGRAEDRARDVLLYACRALAEGTLPRDAEELLVPRRVRLQPGSHLLCEPADPPPEGEHEPGLSLGPDRHDRPGRLDPLDRARARESGDSSPPLSGRSDPTDAAAFDRYRVRERTPEWLVLERDAPALPA